MPTFRQNDFICNSNKTFLRRYFFLRCVLQNATVGNIRSHNSHHIWRLNKLHFTFFEKWFFYSKSLISFHLEYRSWFFLQKQHETKMTNSSEFGFVRRIEKKFPFIISFSVVAKRWSWIFPSVFFMEILSEEKGG